MFEYPYCPFSIHYNWLLAVFLQNTKGGRKKSSSKEFGFPQKKTVLGLFTTEIWTIRTGQLKIELWEYELHLFVKYAGVSLFLTKKNCIVQLFFDFALPY